MSFRLFRWFWRCLTILANCFLALKIWFETKRRSNSICFSPLPLNPEPPCWLYKCSFMPARRGNKYWPLAISTCSFASLVFARTSKIRKIRAVRSVTSISKISVKFFTCSGDNSSLKITRSRLSNCPLISWTFPVPIYNEGLILSRFCTHLFITSILHALHNSSNSINELSKS